MLIYVIAGEPSGDLLGGRLMAALREMCEGNIQFAGIGGETMQAEGLNSLFPMRELTVMGLVEVLPRIPRILRRVRETLDDIAAKKPDAIVTIDSWGFTGRVQKGCQKRFPDLPRIHYVAPMVWAWKPERAGKLAAVLDLLMTLLPFEPEWFEKAGLRSIHVGHPVIEGGAEQGRGQAFRDRHGITAEAPVLVALPGSRRSETAALLPIFAQVMTLLRRAQVDITVVVPTVDTVADTVRSAAADWPFKTIVLEGRDQRYDVFAAGTVAIAASGTVSLELAMAGLPAVVLYRVSPVTAFIARRFMGFKIKWASLVNMVMDRPVMPEFLQEECRAEPVVAEIQRLLADPELRDARRHQMEEAMRRLGYGQSSPSRRAAQAVLDFIAERKSS